MSSFPTLPFQPTQRYPKLSKAIQSYPKLSKAIHGFLMIELVLQVDGSTLQSRVLRTRLNRIELDIHTHHGRI